MDGKRRLPLVYAAEAHFKSPRINDNCFSLYAFDNLPGDSSDDVGMMNVPAVDYLMRGLIAKKQAELSEPGSNEEKTHLERSLANLQMSLEAKPDYLCAFRLSMEIAERLGLDDVVEGMEYNAGLNTNMDHECPFLDSSYQSAEELAGVVKRMQLHLDEWSPVRAGYQRDASNRRSLASSEK